MIGKDKFIDLISGHKEYNAKIDRLSEALGVPIFDNYFVEQYNLMFEEVLRLQFTDEGFDDITWWLYEKDGRGDMKMWDEDGKEIPTESLEDLWNLVKSSRI